LSYDWKHLAKIGRKAVKEPFPVAAERMPRVPSRKKQLEEPSGALPAFDRQAHPHPLQKVSDASAPP